MNEISEQLASALGKLDTPTVCNALELVAPERRAHGFTTQPLVCTRPELPPMVGVARTARIRAAHPNDLSPSQAAKVSDEYYAYIDAGPKPSVVVIQDLDDHDRGYGAFWGEVNSNIHAGFGALGVITDGSVRDLPDVAPNFQMLADRVGPSHAYVHVVDYGGAVTVCGMRVSDGDLIHADQHGAVVIPWSVADQIVEAANKIAAREAVIIQAAQTPGFNIHKLREALGGSKEVKH